MSTGERVISWILIISGFAAIGYFVHQLDQENNQLRTALLRLHQDQEQLNNNFRVFTLATEQQLTKNTQELQGISSRVGAFRASKDAESGAVVWE